MINKINVIIILCIILASCQKNDENELVVLPVEQVDYSGIGVTVFAPIPVMNGIISFIPGENTPQDATYRMYFDSSENPTTTFELTSTEKEYTNLKINTTYYWRVETLSSNGEVLASSQIWNFTTSNTITVRTQEDLNLLGSNNYSEIIGTLVIGDDIFINSTLPNSTNITDLSPLSDLTQVVNLIINNNNSLTNLNGLSNLEVVYNNLFIGQGDGVQGGNSSLGNISALSNIESLDGNLIIYNNEQLSSLNGLQSLKSVGKHLVIVGNDDLKSLNGLESLQSIGEYFEIYDNINLDNFCALENLINNTSTVYGPIENNKYNPTRTDLINGICEE